MVLSWTETQTAPPAAKGGAIQAKLPHIAGFTYRKKYFKERLELISFEHTGTLFLVHLITPLTPHQSTALTASPRGEAKGGDTVPLEGKPRGCDMVSSRGSQGCSPFLPSHWGEGVRVSGRMRGRDEVH